MNIPSVIEVEPVKGIYQKRYFHHKSLGFPAAGFIIKDPKGRVIVLEGGALFDDVVLSNEIFEYECEGVVYDPVWLPKGAALIPIDA